MQGPGAGRVVGTSLDPRAPNWVCPERMPPSQEPGIRSQMWPEGNRRISQKEAELVEICTNNSTKDPQEGPVHSIPTQLVQPSQQCQRVCFCPLGFGDTEKECSAPTTVKEPGEDG